MEKTTPIVAAAAGSVRKKMANRIGRGVPEVTDAYSKKCSCNREKATVFCRSCGFYCNGRIRLKCQQHPRVSIVYILNPCCLYTISPRVMVALYCLFLSQSILFGNLYAWDDLFALGPLTTWAEFSWLWKQIPSSEHLNKPFFNSNIPTLCCPLDVLRRVIYQN